MSREEVYEQVNEVFATIFDDVEIKINDETTSDDIEDWDSLEHINLVVAIEKRFNIRFDMSEVNKLNNVGEMVDIILSRV